MPSTNTYSLTNASSNGHQRVTEDGNRHSRIGGPKPFPPNAPDAEMYEVDFNSPADPSNPQNWSPRYKLWLSTIACYGTLVATFDSAVFAPGTAQASHDLSVGEEVGKLGTSLFVLGFALGPLIWAPGSELIGRRWPLLVGVFGCAVFSIASATAKDIQTLIICRFFGGVFGASPLCVVPAVLSDLYDEVGRGIAISVYALTVFVGPLAGPFIGAFMTMSYLHWRWTLYLPSIMGLFDVLLLLLFLEETYAPVILIGKAKRIRKETGNWCIHARHEHVEFDLRQVIHKYLIRPVRMLVTEPIVLLVSLYMSFVYGILYAFLESFPYIFEKTYGMNDGVAALPLIGVIIGVSMAVCFVILRRKRDYKRLAPGESMSPEVHLFPPIIGGLVFAAALLWFAWASLTVWIVPTIAGAFVGFGLLSIFLPCFNYLVDAYPQVTASVVASNVMLRSSIAAGFPLFTAQMFENLGIQWAGTLLGCLAAVMIPIPLVFRVYGARLRCKSRMLLQSPPSRRDVEKSEEA